MNDVEKLSHLFNNCYGRMPLSVTVLPGAGSSRKYYRLSAGADACIGVAGDDPRDCRAFVAMAEAFRNADVPVPAVYAVSEDGVHYIQEDLGDTSLFDLIKKGEGEEYVKAALTELARMQCVPGELWENAVEYAPFSVRQIHWDLNYFKYEYLRPSGFLFDENALEDDFERLASDLMSHEAGQEGFMYRDFQSRNVMVREGRVRFIDFQGGRRGPAIYDAVSFLWQAKAGFRNEFRMRMLKEYADEFSRLRGCSADVLLDSVDIFALFRTLQVLGAYGLRGLVEKKAHFIESIPAALDNLRDLLDRNVCKPYPALESVLRAVVADERFRRKENDGRLTVTVYSFSYKKGYPADYSGNGGGFMFDCRGMHNPGRYDEFKPLTGMDRPVIDFLEAKGEVQEFVDNAMALVVPSVECYLRRGFSSLQVGFGCTGGRHRSVYCAGRMARLLAERFPAATIRLIHREQNVEEEFN